MRYIVVTAEYNILSLSDSLVAVLQYGIAEPYLIIEPLSFFLAVRKIAVNQFVIRIIEDDTAAFCVKLIYSERFDCIRFCFCIV